jgi:hypothetical protein
VHAHHVDPRSHGGADTEDNLVALCACHHLRGIHGGYIRVRGRAPDRLVWEVGGRVWTGGRPPARSAAGPLAGGWSDGLVAAASI